METTTIVKKMLCFQKTAFDNTFNAMVALQDQTEMMAGKFLGQSVGIPEEGQKYINDWVKAFKKGREDFKKSIDENFNKVETFF